ncbi:thioesterase domain-containing protein [Actinomadura keratinilytica]
MTRRPTAGPVVTTGGAFTPVTTGPRHPVRARPRASVRPEQAAAPGSFRGQSGSAPPRAAPGHARAHGYTHEEPLVRRSPPAGHHRNRLLRLPPRGRRSHHGPPPLPRTGRHVRRLRGTPPRPGIPGRRAPGDRHGRPRRQARRELADHAGDRPVVLYGHCAGSTLAYEVARRLGPARVQALVASSHPAPGSTRREPTWALPRPEFLQQVVRDGYLPEQLLANEELLDIVEPALRADYELLEAHELKLYESGTAEPVAVPTVAVYGREDHTLRPAQAEAWSALTTGPFRAVALPGGHDLPGSNPSGLAAVIRDTRSPLLPAAAR